MSNTPKNPELHPPRANQATPRGYRQADSAKAPCRDEVSPGPGPTACCDTKSSTIYCSHPATLHVKLLQILGLALPQRLLCTYCMALTAECRQLGGVLLKELLK